MPERKDHKKIQEAFAILKKRGIPQTITNAIPVYDELVAKGQAIVEIEQRVKTASANGITHCVSNEEVLLLLNEIRYQRSR